MKKLTKTLNDDTSLKLTPYSVTVRPKGGIDLGSNSSSEGALRVITQLEDNIEYIISLEKQGAARHMQCGILTSKRQDNIRRDLLACFPNFSVNEKKYAIKVKKHNDWQILVNYCCKDGDVFSSKLETAELNIPPGPTYRQLLMKWIRTTEYYKPMQWNENLEYIDDIIEEDSMVPHGFNEWLKLNKQNYPE